MYDQRRVILLSTLEEKHDYCMRHSNGIIRIFISIQLVHLRYVSAIIEKSTDHNSSKING
ncbi:hypothetical protein H5410_021914 [Solanum commersonii]|uniref:Uncharacterized protein n=1 Tax=Solanum commersonii TaxID=4109 RepID=A0A9J5ZCP9_SOLCO|nr:hypothetical protein H5410_021914 [Solanum commersonii]